MDGNLYGTHEEAEEFDLVGVAVHIHQHTSPRLGDARHLTYSARHVRKEHDAELRPYDIEGVVVQLEGVAVHNAGLDTEPLFTRTRVEVLEHDRRHVRREHLRPEARRGDTEGAAAGRHVQKPHARTDVRAAEAFVR